MHILHCAADLFLLLRVIILATVTYIHLPLDPNTSLVVRRRQIQNWVGLCFSVQLPSCPYPSQKWENELVYKLFHLAAKQFRHCLTCRNPKLKQVTLKRHTNSRMHFRKKDKWAHWLRCCEGAMEGEDRVRSASLKAKLIGRLSHIFSTNKREKREVIKLENCHFIYKDRFSRGHLYV